MHLASRRLLVVPSDRLAGTAGNARIRERGGAEFRVEISAAGRRAGWQACSRHSEDRQGIRRAFLGTFGAPRDRVTAVGVRRWRGRAPRARG